MIDETFTIAAYFGYDILSGRTYVGNVGGAKLKWIYDTEIRA